MPTTNLGLRYPAQSDAPNVAQDLQNLASDTDAKLRIPVVSTISARNSHGTPYAGKQMLVGGNLHTHDGTDWRFTLTGTVAGTGNGSGMLSIAHGGGRTPTDWGFSQNNTGVDSVNYSLKIIRWSADATNLTVRAVNEDSNVYMASNPINVTWWAKF